MKVLGVLCLIDDGEADWKVIAIDEEDRWARELNDVQVCGGRDRSCQDVQVGVWVCGGGWPCQTTVTRWIDGWMG